MAATRKLTAGNCPLLRDVKAEFNHLVYRRALGGMNAEGELGVARALLLVMIPEAVEGWLLTHGCPAAAGLVARARREGSAA